MLSRGRLLGGRYEIISPLGAGGMGEVYQAHDRVLNRDVALKIVPPELVLREEALRRFEREAKTLAALSHPNILAIHDFGSENGIYFLVTELLKGETLRSFLKQSRLPLRKTIETSIGIAEGLSAAHASGVIHRDLKPENIFLRSDGTVKILDFGLARQLEAAPQDVTTAPTESHYTAPDVVLGTGTWRAAGCSQRHLFIRIGAL
jgi:serine/threonine protein kinase